jgi:hypothetical protein
MYVRNAGGVSNRSGFEFVKIHEYQGEKMESGGTPGIKGINVYDNVNKTDILLEYRARTTAPFNYDFFKNSSLTGLSQIATAPSYNCTFENVTPEQVRYTVLRDDVLFTPTFTLDPIPAGSDFLANPVYNFSTGFIQPFSNHPVYFATITASSVITGTVLTVPVTYKITGIFEDGVEREMYFFGSPASYVPGAIIFPQANTFNNIQVTLSAAVTGLKYFNVYRASGLPTDPSLFFKLAQKIRYTGGTLLKFTDFAGEDASSTAPEETNLYGKAFPQLRGANSSTVYQQRLVLSYDETQSQGMKVGEIGASRIGGFNDLRMPLVFNNTGPFQFSVPVEDSTPVVAFLPMERLIVFTERRTYVIRGGEQGVLTPTTVNPYVITETGCSRIVEPKMKGRRGFFLNNDHTKLMAIEFGDDANLRVSSISVLSDHLISQDIHAMEVVGGKDDIIILLKRDGTAVTITIEDDIVGFSTLNTDGFIENMYVKKELKPYESPYTTPRNDPEVETAYFYVIRDGVRLVERMVFREDEKSEGMVFSDSSAMFGYRNRQDSFGFWNKLFNSSYVPETFFGSNEACNIFSATNYSAGTTVQVDIGSTLVPGTFDTYPLAFYYDDNGVEKKIIFTPDGGTAVPSSGSFVDAVTGTFDKDVPISLQNADVTAASSYERNSAVSRWLPLFDEIRGLSHLEGKEVSLIADGEILSSPLNPNKSTLTVPVGGILPLPGLYAYGVVGLPYESEMETLDLEASDGRTFTDANKLINSAGIAFNKTRGGFISIESQAAVSLSDASPLAPDDDPEFPAERPSFSDHIEVAIPAQWSKRGRVNVRQVDPLPLTVLSVYPKGMVSN